MKQGYGLIIGVIITALVIMSLWLWRVQSLKPIITKDSGQSTGINLNNLQNQTDDHNQAVIDELNK